MKKYLLITCLFIISGKVFSQPQEDVSFKNKNVLKLNLFSLALKSGSLQYERIITKRASLSIGGRYMPTSKVPYIKNALEEVLVNDAKLSNYSITPEIRFYVGKKGYGQGFYIGPYYRYASFEVKDVTYDFESEGSIKTAQGYASVSSHSGGILLGAQWFLGKRKKFVIDWTILGAHYGFAKGSGGGVYNGIMTPEEQQDLKKKIEEEDIPFIKKTATVTANGVDVKVDGPWAGLRSAFSIGIRF